jgi:phospholipid/cholesterol/gamma-HCH transport system permease protein
MSEHKSTLPSSAKLSDTPGDAAANAELRTALQPNLFKRGWNWLRVWWYILHFAAIMMVLALSPSSYHKNNRLRFAEHVYISTWQVLPWFTVLSTLICLVLVRIVVVTAQSYGLSSLALEVVVRVLVLELIPLSAALFVVLRTGLYRCDPEILEPIDYLPQVLGTTFSVLLLAAIASTLTLILAYLAVYGFSPWGFPAFTHMVGHVFDPAVMVIFCMKSFLFSLSVAIIPLASGLQEPDDGSPVAPGTVRLFLVLVLIEAGMLAIKYI